MVTEIDEQALNKADMTDTDVQTCYATEHSGNDPIQNVSMLLIQNVAWPVSDM